ncbi:MAG: hypothetical protein KGL35_27610 [Bradyrhizobium sp.]|uniref:hypothetical protein n=1 Tax=Bradyrhizobium sp. TaxID=376 RepID=UPI001C293401|nr:hypothetical protein [Bradyrhizobium sp.]MBU6463598.1 hypothetical protein [Pseudomonadota bacterium]MDE2067016.1 hypothetical protein [Bradyrhizobium sp.]MDE2472395.1 hypothetical protein [Bradyrhizobium sp.]
MTCERAFSDQAHIEHSRMSTTAEISPYVLPGSVVEALSFMPENKWRRFIADPAVKRVMLRQKMRSRLGLLAGWTAWMETGP